MGPCLALGMAFVVITYLLLQFTLHATQSRREPCVLESRIPFFDAAIGILKHRTAYFPYLRSRYNVPIHTLRMPFQRTYVVHASHLVQTIQSKANASTFVPNLLDFGMLFSGMNKESRIILRQGFGVEGNSFTKSVHRHLLCGPSLVAATQTAVERLSRSIPNSLGETCNRGLLDWVKHELAMAFTGAIYGQENIYDNPDVERDWNAFVPGISHLLSSPFPKLTARKALLARSRLIHAFRKYFETGGHLQAFSMVSEMYNDNIRLGLAPEEAAKMEMATSLAMLSSGANTTFWLLYHIFTDNDALEAIREEILAISTSDPENLRSRHRTLSLDQLKAHCPTLVAMLNETLRYHSSVINIKEVQHNTTLANQYLLKKKAVIMIPGHSIHHEKSIWGPSADAFDHNRFLVPGTNKKLSSTSAFRPFGAGATMCPGRNFSTNVILSLAAMVVLQYDILPVDTVWTAPTKRNADFWNAMPKPDWDINVRFTKRVDQKQVEWNFVWAEDA